MYDGTAFAIRNDGQRSLSFSGTSGSNAGPMHGVAANAFAANAKTAASTAMIVAIISHSLSQFLVSFACMADYPILKSFIRDRIGRKIAFRTGSVFRIGFDHKLRKYFVPFAIHAVNRIGKIPVKR